MFETYNVSRGNAVLVDHDGAAINREATSVMSASAAAIEIFHIATLFTPGVSLKLTHATDAGSAYPEDKNTIIPYGITHVAIRFPRGTEDPYWKTVGALQSLSNNVPLPCKQ
jgi:hypothetical protein